MAAIMSRYPRYPYQSTTIPNVHVTGPHHQVAHHQATNHHQHHQQHHQNHHQNHHQQNHHQQNHHQQNHHQQNHHQQNHQNHQGHQTLSRNPWVGPAPCESQSTSSSSSRTYRGGAGPALPWQQNDQHGGMPTFGQHGSIPTFAHTMRPVYQEHMVEVVVDGPGRHSIAPLLPPAPSSGGTSAPTVARCSGSSRAASDRPNTPSSPGGHSAAVDGCGGHCVACETFCYYFLQVIFTFGILAGISLTIAGSVLRSQQRGGDLLVLVYIGCMTAMVCSLLLSVQCCVRRNVKRRKRSMRSQRSQRRVAHTAEIPMQDMGTLKVMQGPMARGDLAVGSHRQHAQYQPLLMHIVQQQAQGTAVPVDTLPRQQYHHAATYRSGNTTDTSGFVGRMLDVSRSGTPWWRRHAEMAPHVVESTH